MSEASTDSPRSETASDRSRSRSSSLDSLEAKEATYAINRDEEGNTHVEFINPDGVGAKTACFEMNFQQDEGTDQCIVLPPGTRMRFNAGAIPQKDIKVKPTASGAWEGIRGGIRGGTKPTAKKAVLFGNNKFTTESPLKFCVRDAEEFSKLLTRLSFDVSGPHKNNNLQQMQENLKEFSGKNEKLPKKEQALTVVFFASHGCVVKGEQYIHLKDAKSGLRSVQQCVLKSGCPCLFVIDACRNNKTEANTVEIGLPGKLPHSNFGVLYACDKYDVTRESRDKRHGHLTWALLKVLGDSPSLSLVDVCTETDKLMKTEFKAQCMLYCSLGFMSTFSFQEERESKDESNSVQNDEGAKSSESSSKEKNRKAKKGSPGAGAKKGSPGRNQSGSGKRKSPTPASASVSASPDEDDNDGGSSESSVAEADNGKPRRRSKRLQGVAAT